VFGAEERRSLRSSAEGGEKWNNRNSDTSQFMNSVATFRSYDALYVMQNTTHETPNT
jgi:hypothetical protein